MFLVIDGNNVAWAGFHSLRKAMGAEEPEQLVRAGLLGLTQSIVGFIVRRGEPPLPGREGQVPMGSTPVTRVAVVFDEGRPLRRRSVFPGYQKGRESNPSFMDNEKYVLEAVAQFTEMAMACLPLAILRGVNVEADDLIAATILQGDDKRVRICSTDRDFLQLVDHRISIYSPVKRLVITHENFSEVTSPSGSDGRPIAFPRERFLDYRAMVGDNSDDLPGIPSVGELTAAKLLQTAPAQAYFEKPALITNVLGRRNVKLEGALRSGEAKAIYERNRELMDLRIGASHFPDLSAMTKAGAWDEQQFRAWVAKQRIAGLEVDVACAALGAVVASVA